MQKLYVNEEMISVETIPGIRGKEGQRRMVEG
jgi:hypothetical protein